MKKILSIVACAVLITSSGVCLNSCAPSAPTEPNVPVTLTAIPDTLTLTRTTLSQSSSVGLSCGCAFPLSVTGYGGDTTLIHFSVGELPDSTTHTVTAFVIPSTLPPPPANNYSAWIGLTTKDDSTETNPGTPLYDTIRVLLNLAG